MVLFFTYMGCLCCRRYIGERKEEAEDDENERYIGSGGVIYSDPRVIPVEGGSTSSVLSGGASAGTSVELTGTD